MPKVLIVEDDPALLRGVADNFAARGYRVERASDGETGLELARRARPDLLILDVMLPRVNGYEICRCLRRDGIATPVIFLTARSEESDVLLGLGLGADDYVKKPFGIRELLARAEAVLRRAGEAGEGGKTSGAAAVEFGGYVFDGGARTLRGSDGADIPLSPKEYGLLAFLIENAGRALGRDEIMDAVWGYDSRVTPRTIDRFVTALRKKIEPGDPGAPAHIETIREFGYRFRL
ncbi:MAG: response regulator transcription factor [Akkermansiaceae bacterium]|nr:response regulator transcription factor [Akkermansiaceae bacterium]